MKKIISAIILVFSFVSVANAETPATATTTSAVSSTENIAVIDIQKIMTNALVAKNMQEQVEAKRDAYQKKIAAQEDNLVKENQELTKKKATMSDKDFEPLLKAFNEKVMKAQTDVQDLRNQLDIGYANAVNDVQKAVLDIVTTLSQEKKYSVVIPSSQLLFAKKEMDITDEVLKKLDAKVQKLTVKFEMPKEDATSAKDKK